MKVRKIRGMVLFFLVLMFMASPGFAQPSSNPVPSEKGTNLDQNKLIVEGKIASMGGRYYVMGKNPPGELLIVNDNPQVLGKLLKEGKSLMVEGHTTLGADLFFIEKIDGKPYSAEK